MSIQQRAYILIYFSYQREIKNPTNHLDAHQEYRLTSILMVLIQLILKKSHGFKKVN